MTNRSYNRSKRMLFTGLLLGSVILLLIPHGVTGKLQSIVTGVFSLPLRMGRIASLAARVPLTRASASASEFHRLQLDKQQEQANHIANLEARLSEQEAEIERLSRFRSTPNWERTGFIPADATHNLSADRLVINRGLKDGVRVGQYVIASNAIIGLICESEAGNSRLALVSDPKCRIPAYIQSDQTSDQTLGMVTGMGQGKVKITNVKSNQTVKAGDKVYAKAWPGRLEHPFLIGEVQEVKDDRTDPLLLDISVRPAAKLLEVLKVSVIHCGQPI
ncbi:MAG: hypothetical protein IIC50_01515 [Planctomycetes bacterium]|nr:hypothetical protein [Planctomycetota bacterium]